MHNNIEIWGLISKVKENSLDLRGSWNCISVANACGDIYIQLDDGILIRHDPVQKKDLYLFQGGHNRAIAYAVSTSDD